MTEAHTSRPPLRHEVCQQGIKMHTIHAIQRNRTRTSGSSALSVLFQSHRWYSPARHTYRGIVSGDSTALSVNLWTTLRDGKSPLKQNTMTVSALAKALCLLTCVWDSRGQVRTCSDHGFGMSPVAAPSSTAHVKSVCMWVLSPPHSYWPALLAGHQADRDRVRELPAAALLPDPVQRRERRGLPGPGRTLGHHQFPHLQVCFTSSAENRRGPPFQVSVPARPALAQPLSKLLPSDSGSAPGHLCDVSLGTDPSESLKCPFISWYCWWISKPSSVMPIVTLSAVLSFYIFIATSKLICIFNINVYYWYFIFNYH